MRVENSLTLEELYYKHEKQGATFTIEDGEITGVEYGDSVTES